MTTTLKEFPTASVLSVMTGFAHARGEYGRDVMDHLFPGIFCIGAAAMQPKAAAEMRRQFPEVAAYCDRTNMHRHRLPPWVIEWFAQAKLDLPATLAVAGPLDVPDADVTESFDAFLAKAKG